MVAESKEVRLPRNEVTLIAHVAGHDETSEEEKYQFTWTSLHQPEGSTAVKHQNGGKLHLEKMMEGVYEFKVILYSSKYEMSLNNHIINILLKKKFK